MPETASRKLPLAPSRRFRASRTVTALVLREMSSSYGGSGLGYLWAVLEPVAGIMLLTFIFSLALERPALGTSFALFYASGLLPFLAYHDISQKVSQSLRFSQPLLAFPTVTFLDALIARLVLNSLTQIVVICLVLGLILVGYQLPLEVDPSAFVVALGLCIVLAAGVGFANCYLVLRFPAWERLWSILNRPMFLISCIFYLFDSVPEPFRSWLWYNPVIHLIGQFRKALYPIYDGPEVAPLYVVALSLVLIALSLTFLRRDYRQLLHR